MLSVLLSIMLSSIGVPLGTPVMPTAHHGTTSFTQAIHASMYIASTQTSSSPWTFYPNLSSPPGAHLHHACALGPFLPRLIASSSPPSPSRSLPDPSSLPPLPLDPASQSTLRLSPSY
ncbi:hypothetical protein CDD82_7256 [Ophiocordyceps australis]|uniref:Uncharacterized protein n=1 Tax=Ophiocordyceps australis TaxID=1399860 RepID=A0A2C5YSC9_9HYPO|nr:hypothetical protein CDD82_7256 [Ophiocordyceps australis]